jgi:hypothetical protein
VVLSVVEPDQDDPAAVAALLEDAASASWLRGWSVN